MGPDCFARIFLAIAGEEWAYLEFFSAILDKEQINLPNRQNTVIAEKNRQKMGSNFLSFSHFPRHFRAHPDFWRHSLGHRYRSPLRLLNALNSEDRGLKVRFSLAMIVVETFELILCQMLPSQRKNAPSNPYPHYLVRLATSRNVKPLIKRVKCHPLN